ncbi:MAG: MFS transporter [Alphaproteobacteria bacterium]|nr:MFS transporter [Alphaproteobacteria bacterium]
MQNPPSEAVLAEWRRGWRIVLGAGIGMGTGVALYLLLASLFITRVTSEFGWSRGDLALAGAGSFLVAALALGFIGRFLDRFGFRAVVLVCVPALCIVYFGLTQVNGSFPFYVTLLLVGGIFGGGTGAMVYTRPVIAAFDKSRGLALGVAASGTSIASMIVAPILAAVIAAYGWRAGAYGLIAVTAFVGLPLALWLIGSAKEARATAADDLAGDEGVPTTLSVTLAEAIRGPAFWLIMAALVAVNIPGSGVVGQLAPMITDKGLSETQAGLAMSIYAIGLLSARLATGFALDRFPAPNVAAIATGVPAIGALLLLVPDPNFAIAAFAVLLIGMQQGAEIDLLAFFVSRNFGTKNYGSIYGAIAMAGALASAGGVVLFGKVHDITKSYDAALMIGAVAFVVGASAFFTLRYARTSV